MNKVTPTLYIALGGTGAEIALRLRRRILTHSWGYDDNRSPLDSLDDFPFAQFIFYDLDPYSMMQSGKDTASDPYSALIKFSDEERLCLKLDLDKYLRTDHELDRYPLIASWFPLTSRKIRELGIDGFRLPCARLFGRLYFFDKYQLLRNSIRSKIDYLLSGFGRRDNLERLGVDVEPVSLRVVVIASTAGGTGSGSFIDMGYLAKVLGKACACGSVKVDLMLLLPGGYLGHAKTRCEANTYAALMELETCMGQGGQFVTGWSHYEDPDLPRSPYDDVFLIDTSNLALMKKETVTDAFDMVANSLFEDFIPSDFSNRRKAIRVCHAQYKIMPFSLPVDNTKFGSMKLKFSTAYSAFGSASIEAEMEQIPDEVARGQINNNPLFTMLEEVSPPERRALFRNCLENAMPWVDANVFGYWTVNPDQYMCVIGVDGAGLFEQKFGEEFKSIIPTRTGLTPGNIKFFESGIPGKLTCYVELSGIPLTALNQLPQWRESYDEESGRVPLHIHKDRSLFVHPLAPTSETLARMAEHFKIFIQGIVLGVLRLGRDDDMYVYCLNVNGMSLSIGNERLIRLDGLSVRHLDLLQTQVTAALEQINTCSQLVALVAMYTYYAECVYPPAIIRDDCGWEAMHEGFPYVMCRQLREEAQKRYEEKFPHEGSRLIIRLQGGNGPEYFKALDKWTDVIEESENDVNVHDAGSEHKPKRQLKAEFLQPGWLERQLGIVGGNPAGKSCAACGKVLKGVPNFCPECGMRQSTNVTDPPPLPPV